MKMTKSRYLSDIRFVYCLVNYRYCIMRYAL